jgi:hypothetical protein
VLVQPVADRAHAVISAQPPRPGSLEVTNEFAVYAELFAR